MTNNTCPWRLFDEDERIKLTEQLFITGILSSFMSIWIIFVFCHPSFKDNLSYQNMSIFFKFACVRRFVPVIMGYIIPIRSTYRIEWPVCQLFGIAETFMGVFEVEMLTHICIERYVVAKQNTKGEPMEKRHYTMFRWVSALLAAVYCVFLGWFGYGADFTCTSCTMDVILPEGLMKYYFTAIFVLRSIKPVGFMLYMLFWAIQLEDKLPDTPNNKKEQRITQDAMALTAINLLCWTPIALIRGIVVLMQLLKGPGVFVVPPASLVQISLIAHWSSPINSFATLYCLSPELRAAVTDLRFHHIKSHLNEKND